MGKRPRAWIAAIATCASRQKSTTVYSPSGGTKSIRWIGYRHLLQHLHGERDLVETVRLIKRDTRRYAKRQLTWLRAEEGYRWLSPANEKQRRACAEMIVSAAQGLWSER